MNSSPPPVIPFTLLLDELMPGMERSAQVQLWNRYTEQLHTVETAQAHVLADQHAATMARKSWAFGKHREEVTAFIAQTRASIASFRLDAPPSQPQAQALLQTPLPEPEVSLRSLLKELYSGARNWRGWCHKYNRDMGTSHNPDAVSNGDLSVSAQEARKAREIIPAISKARKDAGRAAGGKAGLKKPAAQRQRKPGFKDF